MSEHIPTRNIGLAVWFTGLSGAGKTTLCNKLAKALRSKHLQVDILDGDEMRLTLCAGLGFSRQDREENIRRIATLAAERVQQGSIVLIAAISPYRTMRREARERIPRFVEVFVNAPLATCIQRDPKGLYRRALANEIANFTGVSDPYEQPLAPDVECDTANESVAVSTMKVMAVVNQMLTRSL